jgi:hypothetical protein
MWPLPGADFWPATSALRATRRLSFRSAHSQQYGHDDLLNAADRIDHHEDMIYTESPQEGLSTLGDVLIARYAHL